MNRHRVFVRARLFVLLVFTTIAASCVDRALAVTISLNLIGNGVTFPISGGTGTNPPASLAGGGNLSDIMRAAADLWEDALQDTHSYTINYGWDGLSGGTLAVATQFVVPQPGPGGTIQFDSDGSSVFFADPTPEFASEYGTYTESTNDYGGGTVITGRVYSSASGAASGRTDLLSVALHEIGHLLGVAGVGSFTFPTYTITAPLPFAGSVIPTTSSGGGHINVNTALMFPSISTGIRRLPTEIDILAAAQNDSFTDINLNPQFFIPEPSTFVLAWFALPWIRRLARRR